MLRRVSGGGGLVSSIRPLLAGTGLTWVSVTMGPPTGPPSTRASWWRRASPSLPVVVDDDTYREAYDVVANTTLWFCHHHLFDLPRRPRFDRHWRAGWEGYRTYNQAVADVVIDRRAGGLDRARAGLPLLPARPDAGRRRPDLRTVHFRHIPFADPNMLRILPDDAAGELLAGLAGFRACGFHARRWETAFRACYADPTWRTGRHRPAPPSFVSSLSSDHEGLLPRRPAPSAPGP